MTVHVKVSVRAMVNQDVNVITIIRYNEDGSQEYVDGVTWKKFNDFDLLDNKALSFPRSNIRIEQ